MLPTAAIKNWAQEQRSETLQASQKKPVLKAGEQKEKQMQDAEQMRSTWGSSETKLRQVDVSHTRLHPWKNRFSSLPPSTYLKSVRKLQPIFNYSKRTTGFYHCKLLYSEQRPMHLRPEYRSTGTTQPTATQKGQQEASSNPFPAI